MIIIDMFTYFMDKNVYIIMRNCQYFSISQPNIVDIHIPMHFLDTCDWMLLICTAMYKDTCYQRFFYISSTNMDDIILSMEVLQNQPKKNVQLDDDQAPFGPSVFACT